MKIFFDTQNLSTGHSHRGIGAYTRLLLAALSKEPKIDLVDSIETAEIIHYPHFDFFLPSLPLTARQKRVVTIHDAIPLELAEHYPAGVRGTLTLWRQQFALKHVDAIITDSLASKQQIHTYLSIPRRKIWVVPLAANPEISYQTTAIQKNIATRYALPAEFILYVGDINYNKNLPVLLNSFAQLRKTYPKLSLVLVGKNFKPQTIPEWHAIKSIIDAHELSAHVQFITSVQENTDLAAIYSQAQAYVQPSLLEGFGLPILEAMQCYCPVICFQKSAMAEVGGTHAVYPEASTATDLTQALITTLSWSNQTRQKWVTQAYSWSKTFTWKKTAQATVAVYHSL